MPLRFFVKSSRSRQSSFALSLAQAGFAHRYAANSKVKYFRK